MTFFKKHKKAFIAFFSVIIAAYAAFLLILPNAINLNSYKRDIQKLVFDNAKLDFDFQEIKIVTTPGLKAGVRVKGAKLSYPNKQPLASVSNAEVKISLIPLIFKTVRVSDITVEKPELFLVYTEDGQIDVAKYVTENLEKQQTTTDTAAAELPVRISDRLPVVTVKDLTLSLKDEKTSDALIIKNEDFVFDKAVLNQHFRLALKGKVLVNSDENINYNIKLSSFFPALTQSDTPAQTTDFTQIDFIEEIVKYSPKADINADLIIEEHAGHIDLNGELSADKISLVLDKKRLPDSFFHLVSSGHKTKLDSAVYVTDTEKALISANIKHGKNLKTDLRVKTDKISFSSLQDFASALLNSLNIENDIALFNIQGFINADFNLKTDMKKFESSGYFKVLNGSVSHKTIPVNIKHIAADVDFSNNSVHIKKAGAIVNGTPIEAKGTLDSKANADIKIESGKIAIAPLFNAFAPVDIKKTYVLRNGILAIDIVFKGKLSEIEPNLNLSLNNLMLQDRLNSFFVSNDSAIVNIKTKGNSFLGDVVLNGSLLKINNNQHSSSKTSLNAPTVKIKITPQDIIIVPFYATMNSSRVDISGSIKNYMKKMKIDILAKGSINSSDIKNLLPKDVKSYVDAKGVIPVYVSVKGNDKRIEVNAQAQSSSSNYFAPITIKKMTGKPGLVNLALVYADDTLTFSDASLYQSNKSDFSKDFSYNKKGALKIVGLTGLIGNVSSSHPSLKLNFSIPQAILVSNFALPKASLQAKGDVNIYGTLTSPLMKGFFNIKDINIPDMLTKVQDVDLELNEETITAKIQNLNLNGTSMNIDADASTKFSNVFLIKTLKVSSTELEVDKLFKVMDKMTQAAPAPSSSFSSGKAKGLVVPVKISNGAIDIQKFKMKQVGGDFIASNITGDFTLLNDLFKLNNLKAAVYGGSVTGNVSYDLASTAVGAKVNGKGLNANNAVTVFAALKDQIMGNVDFDADVKLKGVTYEQQMKTLNGKVTFELKDGQMGSLGRFETFLKADNLISQGFIATKLGSLVNTVAPFNTGKFTYLKGDLKMTNGIAHLNPVKMSGPHMSLLITGQVNILSMISNLQILGSLSPEIENALGPVADLSVEKFAAYIPKFGTAIASALNNYNEAANKTELEKIPALTPEKTNTKSFKVILNGNLNNPPSAVKRFQWLNTPEKIKEEQESLIEAVKPSIPANKEELKQQVKEGLQNQIQNQIENNEKIQELKQNKAVQTFDSIYKFYKNNSKSGSKSNAESGSQTIEGGI